MNFAWYANWKESLYSGVGNAFYLSVVKYFLGRFLESGGTYARDDGSSEMPNLQIQHESGRLSLHNIKIKSSEVNSMFARERIALILDEGLVQSIVIRFSWSGLLKGGISVEVANIHIKCRFAKPDELLTSMNEDSVSNLSDSVLLDKIFAEHFPEPVEQSGLADEDGDDVSFYDRAMALFFPQLHVEINSIDIELGNSPSEDHDFLPLLLMQIHSLSHVPMKDDNLKKLTEIEGISIRIKPFSGAGVLFDGSQRDDVDVDSEHDIRLSQSMYFSSSDTRSLYVSAFLEQLPDSTNTANTNDLHELPEDYLLLLVRGKIRAVHSYEMISESMILKRLHLCVPFVRIKLEKLQAVLAILSYESKLRNAICDLQYFASREPQNATSVDYQVEFNGLRFDGANDLQMKIASVALNYSGVTSTFECAITAVDLSSDFYNLSFRLVDFENQGFCFKVSYANSKPLVISIGICFMRYSSTINSKLLQMMSNVNFDHTWQALDQSNDISRDISKLAFQIYVHEVKAEYIFQVHIHLHSVYSITFEKIEIDLHSPEYEKIFLGIYSKGSTKVSCKASASATKREVILDSSLLMLATEKNRKKGFSAVRNLKEAVSDAVDWKFEQIKLPVVFIEIVASKDPIAFGKACFTLLEYPQATELEKTRRTGWYVNGVVDIINIKFYISQHEFLTLTLEGSKIVACRGNLEQSFFVIDICDILLECFIQSGKEPVLQCLTPCKDKFVKHALAIRFAQLETNTYAIGVSVVNVICDYRIGATWPWRLYDTLRRSKNVFCKTDESATCYMISCNLTLTNSIVVVTQKLLNLKGVSIFSGLSITGNIKKRDYISGGLEMTMQKLAFLFSDDMKFRLPPLTKQQSNMFYLKPIESLKRIGCVSIATLSSKNVSVNFTEHIAPRRSIIVNDLYLVLESCADSTQSAITFLNSIAPTNKKVPFQTEVSDISKISDSINSIDQLAFCSRSQKHPFYGCPVKQTHCLPEDSDLIAEYFDISSGHNLMTTDTVIKKPYESQCEPGILEEDTCNESEIDTIVSMRNIEIVWNLHDGYDWTKTRAVIEKAVANVESRVKEANMHSSRGEYASDNFDSSSSEEEVSDLLFNSIYVGGRKGHDPGEVTREVIRRIESLNVDTENFRGQYGHADRSDAQYIRQPISQHLQRSRRHKAQIIVKNGACNLYLYGESAYVHSKIKLSIGHCEILDCLPSSQWSTFVSPWLIPGYSVDSRPMALIELKFLRSIDRFDSNEIALHAEIQPLRLYVDQDILDFFERFFEFKDQCMGLPEDVDAEPPYIPNVNEILVKLDYTPKKVDYEGLRSGRTTEIMNFFVFEKAEMVLRRVLLRGISGFPRLMQTLYDVWLPDIRTNQLGKVISGIAPVRSIVGMMNRAWNSRKEYSSGGNND